MLGALKKKPARRVSFRSNKKRYTSRSTTAAIAAA